MINRNNLLFRLSLITPLLLIIHYHQGLCQCPSTDILTPFTFNQTETSPSSGETCNTLPDGDYEQPATFFNRLTLTIDGNLTIPGDFTIHGTVIINGTLTIEGNFNIDADAELIVNPNAVLNINGDFNNGGFLTFFNVLFGGEGTSGSNTGTINVGGDYINEIGSNINIGDGGILNVEGNIINENGGNLTVEDGGSIKADGEIIDNTTPGRGIDINGNSIDDACEDGCCGPACATVLPVELTSFSGKQISIRSCLLEWATASEINNNGFYIEKSDDGHSYSSLAWINGHGNSTLQNSYNYLDHNFSNTAYYRLKQVDFDGKTEFHTIIRINNHSSEIRLSPSIVMNHLNIHAPKDLIIHGKVIDSTGTVVISFENQSIDETQELFNRRIQELIKGSYIALISHAGQTKKYRFIKN